MQIQCHFLFPFDMGLELDFTGKHAQEIFQEVSTRKMTNLYFEGHTFAGAEVSTQIYKFGVGLIQISFELDSDLTLSARLSCFAESVHVGKTPIVKYCQSLVDGVIRHASKYADYR